MGDLIIFPLTLRSQSPGSPQALKAPINVFPLTRRAPLIARVARRMLSLRPREAGNYLIEVLELLQDELQAAHVDQATIDGELIAFALAAKATAWPGGRRRPGDTA